MSLLPNQVLPETVPIGTVNEDGTVSINHTWYLLFYNMGLTALPNNNIFPIIEAETFLPRVHVYPNPDPAGTLLNGYSFAPKPPHLIPDSVSVALGLFSLSPKHQPVSLGNAPDILLNQVFGA